MRGRHAGFGEVTMAVHTSHLITRHTSHVTRHKSQSLVSDHTSRPSPSFPAAAAGVMKARVLLSLFAHSPTVPDSHPYRLQFSFMKFLIRIYRL
jgi:hypothetical protein